MTSERNTIRLPWLDASFSLHRGVVDGVCGFQSTALRKCHLPT